MRYIVTDIQLQDNALLFMAIHTDNSCQRLIQPYLSPDKKYFDVDSIKKANKTRKSLLCFSTRIVCLVKQHIRTV